VNKTIHHGIVLDVVLEFNSPSVLYHQATCDAMDDNHAMLLHVFICSVVPNQRSLSRPSRFVILIIISHFTLFSYTGGNPYWPWSNQYIFFCSKYELSQVRYYFASNIAIIEKTNRCSRRKWPKGSSNGIFLSLSLNIMCKIFNNNNNNNHKKVKLPWRLLFCCTNKAHSIY
jgi:hypothetical protein